MCGCSGGSNRSYSSQNRTAGVVAGSAGEVPEMVLVRYLGASGGARRVYASQIVKQKYRITNYGYRYNGSEFHVPKEEAELRPDEFSLILPEPPIAEQSEIEAKVTEKLRKESESVSEESSAEETASVEGTAQADQASVNVKAVNVSTRRRSR